jgi:hypothetical protein
MKLSRLVFLGSALILSANVAQAARDGNPCDDNGNLKGWAKKKYDASYCVPTPTNSAPTVQITAPGDLAEYTEGQLISFQAAANDAEEGDLSSAVSWSSSLDGSISTNTALSAGNHIITASVSDSGNLSANDSIALTVITPAPEPEPEPEPVNSAPTVSIDSPLSGTTVEEGTALLFKGVADDAEDGDLTNNISWYSSVDGDIVNFTTLSVGEHVITATVTDSDGAVSYDEINLSVFEVPTYSLSVTWNAPQQRADGSPLTSEELAGYRINWNNDSNGASGSLLVEDGAATSYQINDLDAGSYRITLNTIDTSGLISSNSTDIQIDLN